MIFGFDMATRSTGWCAGDGSKRPTAGAFKYDWVGDDLGALCKAWNKDLGALEIRFGTPVVAVYETPLLVPSDKLLPLRKIYGMGMFLEWWCQKRNVHCVEIGAKKIKKRITGDSCAKKPVVVDVVRRRLHIELPADGAEDAADAVGAWLTGGVDHYAKIHQPKWDAALMGGRVLL